MLSDFIAYIVRNTGLEPSQARAALGLFLDAAERQEAPLARMVYEQIPGARTLAADMGAEAGAPAGAIARMIERTPGGRTVVVERLLRNLHAHGVGSSAIGAMPAAIASFVESEFGMGGVGHLGDLLGAPAAALSPGELQIITAA